MLRKNLIANYAGSAWNGLMSFAFIPTYIKYLGVESYGLVGIFGLLLTILNLLDIGLTPTLGREMARYKGGSETVQYIKTLLRSVEIIALFIALAISLIVLVSSGWLAEYWIKAEKLSINTVATSISVMGFVIGLRFMEGIYRSSILGLQHQLTYNLVNSSMNTVRAAGAVAVLALIRPSIEIFFIWQGIASALMIIALRLATYSCIPNIKGEIHFSKIALQKISHFAGGMFLITASTLLLTQIDKVLLSKYLTLTQYGFYSLAAMGGSILYVLLGPLTAAFYPKLCELHAKNDITSLTATFHKGAQVVTVAISCVSVIIVIFSKQVLLLWTNDPLLSAGSYQLLQVIIIANLLNSLYYIPYHTQLAFGWTGLSVRLNLVSLVVMAPAYVLAIQYYGVTGALWLAVGFNLSYLFIGSHFMFKQILQGEKKDWLLKDLFLPLIVTISTAVFMRIILPANVTGLIQALLLLTVFFTCLVASVLSAKHLRPEVVKLVHRLRNF
ncbi:MAG: lipopolysaccharide biosynthesis protein [Flavisolibacter sp.]